MSRDNGTPDGQVAQVISGSAHTDLPRLLLPVGEVVAGGEGVGVVLRTRRRSPSEYVLRPRCTDQNEGREDSLLPEAVSGEASHERVTLPGRPIRLPDRGETVRPHGRVGEVPAAAMSPRVSPYV